MTKSQAGRKEKQRGVGDTEKTSVKEASITEWAGMTDWGMAGRKWMRGSGEEEEKAGSSQEKSGILDKEV